MSAASLPGTGRGPGVCAAPGLRRRGTAAPAVPLLLVAGQGVLYQRAALPWHCPCVPCAAYPAADRQTQTESTAGSFSIAAGLRGSCAALQQPPALGGDSAEAPAAEEVPGVFSLGGLCAAVAGRDEQGGLRGLSPALGDRGESLGAAPVPVW